MEKYQMIVSNDANIDPQGVRYQACVIHHQTDIF